MRPHALPIAHISAWLRNATACLCLLLWLVASPIPSAQALTLQETTLPPQQEAIARQLFEQLRCAVCQGQTVQDSNAELAVDMRQAVRQYLQQGKSPTEIKQLLVSQYGEHILMQEPISTRTLPLWFTLAICLSLLLGLGLRMVLQRQKTSA